MNKWLRGFVIFLALLCVAAVIAKDSLARAALLSGVRAASGLEPRVRRVHVAILGARVDIEGLQLYSPAGQADALRADIPELFIEYAPLSLLSGRIHLRKIRVHFKQLVIVRDKNRRYDMGVLAATPVPGAPSLRGSAGAQQKSARRPATKVSVDLVVFQVDKVVYKDYASGAGPKIIELNVTITQAFEHVTDLSGIADLVMSRLLGSAGMSELFD